MEWWRYSLIEGSGTGGTVRFNSVLCRGHRSVLQQLCFSCEYGMPSYNLIIIY